MAFDVQEEASEMILRMAIKVPQLTARLLIASVEHYVKKLEQREPIGLQKLEKLTVGGVKIESGKITAYDAAQLDGDMRVFDKLARQYGVGYSIHKMSDQPGYVVFFRSKNLQQYAALTEEFNKYKLWRDFKMPGEAVAEAPSQSEAFHGEYRPDTDLAVSNFRQAARKPDIIVDMTIVPLAKRLAQATQEAAARAAQQQAERSTKALEHGTMERGAR